MKQIGILLTTVFLLSGSSFADNEIKKFYLKSKILILAETFKGQPDKDFKKQKKLDKLVNDLVEAFPQPPISERLDLLAGSWQQVFGVYNYRKNDGSVDPNLGVNEIYQVVSPEGHYYNVSPLYRNGNKERERITLLRGEYKLTDEKNTLAVKFTKFPGLRERPADLELWELPPLAENDQLDTITIVPTFVVKLFFSGGFLEEVYTDETLRIAYGRSQGEDPSDKRIYILKRVK